MYQSTEYVRMGWKKLWPQKNKNSLNEELSALSITLQEFYIFKKFNYMVFTMSLISFQSVITNTCMQQSHAIWNDKKPVSYKYNANIPSYHSA